MDIKAMISQYLDEDLKEFVHLPGISEVDLSLLMQVQILREIRKNRVSDFGTSAISTKLIDLR